ncbi:MAG: hypothetical protein VZQ27_00930 [Candidatus Cryptobacteroides sp.]|nr:hypothetical protein [Candidatus Cryptobacteroides sp.]
MKSRFFIIVMLLATLLIPGCSCNKETPVDEFYLTDDTVNLRIDNRYMFKYSDLTCQLSYHVGTKTFRAFTDNGSDYFNLTMSEKPTKENQGITADLKYTKGTGVITDKGLKFKAVKINDSGKVWLWCSKSKTAACIQLTD